MRLDSIGLINSFGAIANSTTGIGTSRAKNELISIGYTRRLSPQQLEALGEDELIRKVVCLFPESAAKAWFKVSVANNKLGDNLPDLLLKYLDQLGDRDDQTGVESRVDLYNAKQAFLIASILARQFGKAYILMGIDDGEEFDKPVNKSKIKSIRWLQVLEEWELRPEYEGLRMRSPNYYRIYFDSGDNNYGLIHKSRVLPFWGNRIYSKRGNRRFGEDGISVIQSMFDAYSDWIQGIKAGSSMLADYDVFTLGMKGLGQILLNDKQSGITTGQDAVMNRAIALDMGKSTVRGIIYDMENEVPGSVTRAYQGADSIMATLESRWVAVTGIPKAKLFGELGNQGLSNNQGLAMRNEWAILVQDYAHFWLENLNCLVRYCFLAADFTGKVPDFQLTPNFDLQLTDTEKMEYEKLASDRSKTLVDIGAVTAEEIRSGYQGSVFSSDIVLSSKPINSLQDKPQTDTKDDELLTDEEWEELANISAQDYIEVAEGIADAST